MSSFSDNDTNRSNYEAMSVKELRILLTLRGFDCSQCLEKSELVAAALRLDNVNYDDEARKLFQELNLQPTSTTSRYSNLDPIWKHAGPTTSDATTNSSSSSSSSSGGTVYVGNAMAASDRRTLAERNIVAIVNCQGPESQNYFESDPQFHYHRFHVSILSIRRTVSPLEGGFQDAFDFITHHITQGNSVLIHCLAGAHRAGTVGTAWIMYKTGKSVPEAIAVAKKCRPIIDPFGTLKELLFRLQSDLETTTTTTTTPPPPTTATTTTPPPTTTKSDSNL